MDHILAELSHIVESVILKRGVISWESGCFNHIDKTPIGGQGASKVNNEWIYICSQKVRDDTIGIKCANFI